MKSKNREQSLEYTVLDLLRAMSRVLDMCPDRVFKTVLGVMIKEAKKTAEELIKQESYKEYGKE